MPGSFLCKVAAFPEIIGFGDVFNVFHADVGFSDGALEGDDARCPGIGVSKPASRNMAAT